MAYFIELEVVKAIENDSGELAGIKWECIYVNIDSISYYKSANEVLRPYNKRELLFHNYKNTDESGAINYFFVSTMQQNAFLKGEFEDFMKKHGLRAPSIFDDDAHLSVDAVEIYFFTPDDIRPYRKAKYRVNGYSWQYDNEKGQGQDGYAGIMGVPITELRLCIE